MKTTIKQQMEAITHVRENCTLSNFTINRKQDAALNDAGSTIAGWGFLKASMEARIKEIKKDSRLHKGAYPVSIQINAPLALIQLQLVIELQVLERTLGVPHTKLPIK